VAVERGGRERFRERRLRLADALPRPEPIVWTGSVIRPGSKAACVPIPLTLVVRGLCHFASSRASSSVTTEDSSLVNSGAGTASGVPALIGIDSQRAAVW
jgi:hypothetical protein